MGLGEISMGFIAAAATNMPPRWGWGRRPSFAQEAEVGLRVFVYFKIDGGIGLGYAFDF
jgi:hypothetical protein